MSPPASAPAPNCPLCPRLAAFRAENAREWPHWHNAPVPSFGSLDAQLLVVGLAPGLKGANRTGRPFTGDGAGDVLYPALEAAGFTTGTYDKRPDDGLELVGARITNAVRCVPPKNAPTAAEAKACRPFLTAELEAMDALKVAIVLGGTAHKSTLAALGLTQSAAPFAHGATFKPPSRPGLTVLSSYHCSRYNMNVGTLTEAMFQDVFNRARTLIDA